MFTILSSPKDENSRLTPWDLALQPYNFREQHPPGKANANVSGLNLQAGWKMLS